MLIIICIEILKDMGRRDIGSKYGNYPKINVRRQTKTPKCSENIKKKQTEKCSSTKFLQNNKRKCLYP